MRKLKWTVLAVGEGDAEVALLEHLRSTYLPRSCGSSLKIKQAYGKGAGNVINHAIRYAEQGDFNRCLVLFDTDVDYTDEVRRAAREKQLVTIPCDPCLEGFLLQFHGDNRTRCSEAHKVEFQRRFGGRVQEEGLLGANFSLGLLEVVRDTNPELHKMINTFGVRRSIY